VSPRRRGARGKLKEGRSSVDLISAWQAFKRNGQHPLRDKYPSPYKNQCAIRISKCLAEFGYFDAKSYARSGYAVDGGYALRAEELFLWLNSRSKLGVASEHKVSKGLPPGQGLIYLRDCWKRTLPSGKLERGQTGDHFDFLIRAGSHATGFQRYLGCYYLDWGVSEDLWKGCYDKVLRFWRLAD
jgi:hypothetical protein